MYQNRRCYLKKGDGYLKEKATSVLIKLSTVFSVTAIANNTFWGV